MNQIYSAFGVSACLCLLLASFVSCEKKTEDANEVLLDDNLLRSEPAYKNLLKSRERGENAAFAIQEMKREEDSLFIRVLGGCSEDAFKIIWDGRIAESYPGQVRLVLTHEPAADICDPSAEFLLKADLRKIIGKAGAPEDFVFHLANGSVKQDKSLYSDGSVSTQE